MKETVTPVSRRQGCNFVQSEFCDDENKNVCEPCRNYLNFLFVPLTQHVIQSFIYNLNKIKIALSCSDKKLWGLCFVLFFCHLVICIMPILQHVTSYLNVSSSPRETNFSDGLSIYIQWEQQKCSERDSNLWFSLTFFCSVTWDNIWGNTP